jgi:Xaa-Pro aminopeptidase
VNRLAKVRAEMERKNIGNLFISNMFNIRYLSGFSGSTAGMVVRPEDASLVTDFRNRPRLRLPPVLR